MSDKDTGDLLGDLGKAFDDLHQEAQEGLEEARRELREETRPSGDASDAPRASRTARPTRGARLQGPALDALRNRRIGEDYDPTLEREFEVDAEDLQHYEEAAAIAPENTRENIVARDGAKGILDVYRRLGKKAKKEPLRQPQMRRPRGRATDLRKPLDKLRQAFDEGFDSD